uniref:Putative secreted peptide n=1 Tax=Anopheles braziliensis TaxID=58242 RepID=A0A2M3ZVE2_9DIPT
MMPLVIIAVAVPGHCGIPMQLVSFVKLQCHFIHSVKSIRPYNGRNRKPVMRTAAILVYSLASSTFATYRVLIR